MKACLLERPLPVENRPLKLTETSAPAPRADEVLLKVRACGICRTDLHVCEGELAPRRSPVIPGHQVVGVIEKTGADVTGLEPGRRAGIAWLHRTCGRCAYCLKGKENLCERAEFTGWTRDGGFAEYAVAPADFVYPLPEGFPDLQAAPLLCAGIIGYRALKLTNLTETDWSGARLGIYGFGAAGHVCIQIAKARGAEVFVATRDRARHQNLAGELGAVWVGDTFDAPPVKLDAAIVFAPAGELVPVALAALDRGATLVLGGIYMSPIPQFEYSLLYGERVVRSVANNTRADGREFLAEAARIPVKTSIATFPLEAANDALIALKHDAIRGAGVLVVDPN
ncbi:MAG: zinc-dependent alcohol dehydrogenase family protein [Acidobacteria bacterium]|nr:zinc-dependent alcohol dehydrogenase family protein [Acidobacteriota bacterium]